MHLKMVEGQDCVVQEAGEQLTFRNPWIRRAEERNKDALIGIRRRGSLRRMTAGQAEGLAGVLWLCQRACGIRKCGFRWRWKLLPTG